MEVVTQNLHQRWLGLRDDRGVTYAFTRKLQYLDQTRRYSIAATTDGWEVREERDSKVVRQERYQDWHRVERARRSITTELKKLRAKGWAEVN